MNISAQAIALDVTAFAIAVLVVILLSTRVGSRRNLRRRLRGESAEPEARAKRTALVKDKAPRSPILAWVQRSTLKDQKEANTMQRDLALAGFDHPSAPAIYVVIRFCLAAGLPIAFILGQKLLTQPLTGFTPVIGALGLAALGLLAPRSFIDNRANARKSQMENEFPDALDLMVVCVESGLGMEGAMLRVGTETSRSHPRIAEEFERVSQELRAGRTRAEALRNMAERTQVDVVKAFVTLLIQTDSLGGSIAAALRTYSDEMRKHRMLRAEEKAMRLPVLLTIPLVACILPVIMVAVLLPAVIEMTRNFMPTMAGK